MYYLYDFNTKEIVGFSHDLPNNLPFHIWARNMHPIYEFTNVYKFDYISNYKDLIYSGTGGLYSLPKK